MDYWFKFDAEKFQKELEHYERTGSVSRVSQAGHDTERRSEDGSREDRSFSGIRTTDN